jgi:hypothetical protein
LYAALDAAIISDDAIAISDIPELGDRFWKNAKMLLGNDFRG